MRAQKICRFRENCNLSDAFSPIPSGEKPPGSPSNLNSRIRRFADENGLDVKRVVQRLCTEVMLGTLDCAKKSGVVDVYLAKGGMALEIRFGVRARASRDLDLGILSSGNDLVEVFDRVLAIGFDKFTLKRPKDVRKLENAATYRFAIKIEYMGRPIGTLDVDLNEASHETPSTIGQSGLLTALGLPGPVEVPLLDPYLQLAHKLHGATEPSRADYTNRRSRDILDVLIMASSPGFDIILPKLQRIAREEFSGRPHHRHWPPIVSIPQEWNEQLEIDAASLELGISNAAEIICRFTAFIVAIEGMSVKSKHEYRFVSLQLNLTGEHALSPEAKAAFDLLIDDGWKAMQIGPRPGFVDQLLAIMERQRPSLEASPRLQLRLETQTVGNAVSLQGVLRNESRFAANRVRVVVGGIESIQRLGTVTCGDADRLVQFPYEDQPLRRVNAPFPSVVVEYANDDEVRFEQRGKLIVAGPDASGRFIYNGEGLGPTTPIDRFAHLYDAFEAP